jgi:hypothetical protein
MSRQSHLAFYNGSNPQVALVMAVFGLTVSVPGIISSFEQERTSFGELREREKALNWSVVVLALAFMVRDIGSASRQGELNVCCRCTQHRNHHKLAKPRWKLPLYN